MQMDRAGRQWMRLVARRCLTAAITVAALVACARAVAPAPAPAVHDTPLVHSVGPIVTDSAPPGTMRGVLVDDSTGDPVASVPVQILLHRRTVMTDALGRFQVRFAPFDSFTIDVRRVGYAYQDLHLRLDPSRGYVAVIAMSRRPIMLCSALVASEPTIYVSVRDALSGLAPKGGATVQVTAAGYSDSLTMQRNLGDTALLFGLGRDVTTPMTYSVVVRSPGFRVWESGELHAIETPCNVLAFPLLHVWLVPR